MCITHVLNMPSFRNEVNGSGHALPVSLIDLVSISRKGTWRSIQTNDAFFLILSLHGTVKDF